MPIWDYRPKADIWTGVAIGVGLLVAPVVIPMVVAAARPVVKAALKGGFLLYEKGREALAESMEVVEDLMEEVKSEVRAELTEAKE
ncbi:MAG: DUF5132 domain-containing protein [Thermodesulfobacteriota bacterium]